jgi:hypothetical protein
MKVEDINLAEVKRRFQLSGFNISQVEKPDGESMSDELSIPTEYHATGIPGLVCPSCKREGVFVESPNQYHENIMIYCRWVDCEKGHRAFGDTLTEAIKAW